MLVSTTENNKMYNSGILLKDVGSCGSSVTMGWMNGIQFSAGAGTFLCHHVQTISAVYPPSYPIGTRGSFPRSRVARV